MKKYSSLIQQYKKQDSMHELLDEKNAPLQSANCIDDDCDFDLGNVFNCSAAGCDCSAAMCEECGSANCLDCENRY